RNRKLSTVTKSCDSTPENSAPMYSNADCVVSPCSIRLLCHSSYKPQNLSTSTRSAASNHLRSTAESDPSDATRTFHPRPSSSLRIRYLSLAQNFAAATRRPLRTFKARPSPRPDTCETTL